MEDGPGLDDRRRRGQLERAEIARGRRRLLLGRLRLTLVLAIRGPEGLRLFRSRAARSIKITSKPYGLGRAGELIHLTGSFLNWAAAINA